MRSIVILLLQFMWVISCSFVLLRIYRLKVSRQLFWIVAISLAFLTVSSVFFVSHTDPLFEDFVPVYWKAGVAVLDGPSALMPLLGEGVLGGFVNLPVIAYLFAPFAFFPPYVAGWIFTALGLAAVLSAWWLAADHFKFDNVERGISLVLLAGFGPLVYSVRDANLSHVLLPMLVLAIVGLKHSKDFGAGVMLGLCALLKPPLIVLCLYALVRLRWHVVLGAVTVLLASAAISIAVFGWDAHVLWFTTNLLTYSQDVVAARNSHSIASVLARFHYGAAAFDNWDPLTVPPMTRYLRLALVAVLALVALWAAAPWKKWFVGKVAFEADLMLIIVLVLCASTLSWTHYYGWVLLPMMWLWAFLRQKGSPRVPVILLAIFVLLCSPAYIRWAAPAELEPLLPLVFSYLLVGVLGVYGLLVWARRKIATAQEGAK